MTATHSTKWFWSDWLGDQEVRRLTAEERGVWIDLLALAAVANPYGYVCDDRGRKLTDDEIARVSNVPVERVSELIEGILRKGAASRDRAGRLFNRRMVREKSLAAKRRRNGALGGERTKLKWKGINEFATANGLANTTAKKTAPLPLRKIKTSTEFVAAREEPPHVAAFRERVARAKKQGRGWP